MMFQHYAACHHIIDAACCGSRLCFLARRRARASHGGNVASHSRRGSAVPSANCTSSLCRGRHWPFADRFCRQCSRCCDRAGSLSVLAAYRCGTPIPAAARALEPINRSPYAPASLSHNAGRAILASAPVAGHRHILPSPKGIGIRKRPFVETAHGLEARTLNELNVRHESGLA